MATRWLSLETGSPAEFAPARTMYAAYGFTLCDAFGPYVADDFSVFLTLPLGSGPIKPSRAREHRKS